MNSAADTPTHPAPRGRRPARPWASPARWGIYAFLVVSAAFFLLPLYVMVVTSLKTPAEIREAVLFAWPASPQFDNWAEAWSSACIALECQGIQGGFWRIFFQLMLPMATPMLIVATILQLTGIWNDYLFGLIFAGKDNYPMTVQLNNLVNTTFGERRYHIDMAATILTSLVPLLVYFFSGRWFVRGIAAGAVKG
ncbi:MAG: carbohydrate ABC transporter permease [Rubrivivax sp.]